MTHFSEWKGKVTKTFKRHFTEMQGSNVTTLINDPKQGGRLVTWESWEAA